jgi:hypothetical protein
MKLNVLQNGRSEHLCVLAFCLIVIIGALSLSPGDNSDLHFTLPFFRTEILFPQLCVVNRVLGIPCPGCGLTRSFASTVRMDLKGAVSFNPVGPILFLICIFQIPYRIIAYSGLLHTRPLLKKSENIFQAVTWWVLGGLVVTWLARFL